MGKIPFNVDAYAARLIGRENVSKLDSAILELVKNTYDADADTCIVYYEKLTDTLYIADNGCGMSNDIIEKHWMTIGNSSKVIQYRTNRDRIQTGSKGIGRFALDRIADRCTMLSKMGSSDESIKWVVNWENFSRGHKITETFAEVENVKMSFIDFVSDVHNPIFKKLVASKFGKNGTIFKLSNLRENDNWSEDLVKKIKNSLSTLLPPEIEASFQIYVFCEDTNMDDAKVISDDGVFSYDYKIKFDVNNDGKAFVQIQREEYDFGTGFDTIISEAEFSAEDKDYFKGKPIIKEYSISNLLETEGNSIGKFSGTLYFSKLLASAKDKKVFYYKDFSERRNKGSAFGGIKLYRDNFRVRPYGDTVAFDWLELSKYKTQSPAAITGPQGSWRVSAEQMMGTIHISRENDRLPDQSNREGIQETKEFILFKRFIRQVINDMEWDRQYVAKKLRKLSEKRNEIGDIEKEIEEKAKIGKVKSKDQPAEMVEVEKVQKVIEHKEDLIQELEDENKLLRVLATTGIVANSYIHEIKSVTHHFSLIINSLKRAVDKNSKIDTIKDTVQDAFLMQKRMNSWFKVTIESVRRQKRDMQLLDLQPFMEAFISSWKEVLDEKKIGITFDVAPNIEFNCFPYELEIIISNLIANSVYSFKRKHSNSRDIIINVTYDKGLVIDYRDTGIGLIEKYKKNPNLILNPFETSRINDNGEIDGTGMGMWIIDKTVKDYNGEIDLSDNTKTEEGFFVKIFLKTK